MTANQQQQPQVQWGWRLRQDGAATPAASWQDAKNHALAAAVTERDAGREPWAYVCWRSGSEPWKNHGAVGAGLPVIFEHKGARVLADTDGTLRLAVDVEDTESVTSVPMTRDNARALRDALTTWLDTSDNQRQAFPQ